MPNLDFNLIWWNGLIVHPLMAGLRAIAEPLSTYFSPGIAGGLAIILFTVVVRFILLPLSLAQVRSQKAQMAIQPEMKEIQRKYKGDREGLARAQMTLYKERGVNPAAGCLPLLVQMPILFGMYSAMLQLSTQGLTLDQVQTRRIESGRIVYQAVRTDEPLPFNQWVATDLKVVPTGTAPVVLELAREGSSVSLKGQDRLEVVSSSLTLTPGQVPSNPGLPSVPGGKAGLSLHPGGIRQDDGTLNRNVPVEPGKPFIVEINVSAPQTHTDSLSAVVTWDPATATVSEIETRPVVDVPFKSAFLWLPSLGEYDVFNVAGLPIPGLLLILMTITTFLTTRMTAMPVEDPQQQAMMRTMAFMPLMYLFFFSQTPAGLVLYWLISNTFTIGQQFFTTGLGMLAGDIKRFTGRNLQPAWANSLPAPAMPLRNGTSSNSSSDDNDSRPAAGQSETANARRARAAAASKGRKRGKR